ncbi:MAG: ABC transporter ATP-binding protein [Chloroflexi bacterium]|jgi:multiple sugar transport system ATP-binding protein|uniref:ABC transporter ATP-binding protein n=1 Tax=Candidatus Flexifilum breve TaxID=3140694 RepID=UPI0031364D7E|nr:ABC transporter ATP-binding protein [Chloroflexota bacterium]
MSDIRLENITKQFGDTVALDDISLQIKDREFFVLLGPTGAGKTTTLRVIAGLEKQNAGSVYFDGENINELTPADRDTAFVFQQYSLYPNMSVYDNLAFPLRSPLRKTPEDEIRQRVLEAAEKLRIMHLIERKTAKLSGGEMQRVSIGRAIVRSPRIFLMDEPLSNLDAKLRESLRVELKHLQKTQGSTTLFVTHDQIEALTMADRIAVLDAGKILQVGTPHDIYDRPATTFVAQLVGTPKINLLPARRENGSLNIVQSALSVPTPTEATPAEVLVGIRPEDVKPGSGDYRGKLVLTEPLGVETILHLQSGEQLLTSVVPGTVNYRLGDELPFTLARERLHFFDVDGARL